MSDGIAVRAFRSLTANFALKFVSLIISISVYVVLHSGGDAQRTVDVDLLASPPRDPNKILLTPLPPRVHVTVRGPRVLLDDLPNTIEPMLLDLNAEPTFVRLEDAIFRLPLGVTRVHVTPPFLPLRWDVKVQKLARIEPVWGAAPEGLSLKSLTVFPTEISIGGPKSLVDPVQRLRTTSLDLTFRAAGKHTQKLNVGPMADPTLVGVELDAESVEVRFELIAETRTHSFTDVAVVALHQKGLILRPKVVTIVVTCPKKRADELRADALVPIIDVDPEFAKSGPDEAEVKLAPIPGCTDLSVNPAKVTVTRETVKP